MRIYLKDFDESLTKDQLHYLKNVLRLKPFETFNIFNETMGEYQATLTNTNTLQIGEIVSLPILCNPKALGFPLIKSARLSMMLEKATELGATDLYPLICERAQYREFNTERYLSVIKEASEQCGRFDLPTIHPIRRLREPLPTNFNWYFGDIVQNITQEIRTNGNQNTDSNILINTDSAHSHTQIEEPYGIIVGPEGGFSKDELIYLRNHFKPINMGRLVLRSETAAIFGLSRNPTS